MNKPFYSIEMRGEDVTAVIRGHLAELRLNDRSGSHADSLELELADDPRRVSWPEMGAELAVEFGYEGGSIKRKHGRFAIDQVEHAGPPSRLVVSATTADFTSQARAPRERSHGSLTLGELIEKLASEHGYEARVVPEELARVRLHHVDQAGQSDLALAWEVARAHDAVFKPVDGLWWVRSYEALGEPTATIRPADVSTWRAHFLARAGYASVKAHYHDFDTAQRVPVVVGEGEPQLVLDTTFVDAEVARWQAQAAMGRARRESRRLSLRMPGRPDLVSQQVIRLEGFRERVDDAWLITEVVHTINKRGYSCRVECEGV
ncbi:MAG: hypothetical protein JJU06_12665 [Ectothiorhodospiraceae bacterium]|nr:hypothetical protein [Ectothiorhodospiraceae bacterium]